MSTNNFLHFRDESTDKNVEFGMWTANIFMTKSSLAAISREMKKSFVKDNWLLSEQVDDYNLKM